MSNIIITKYVCFFLFFLVDVLFSFPLLFFFLSSPSALHVSYCLRRSGKKATATQRGQMGRTSLANNYNRILAYNDPDWLFDIKNEKRK